MYKLTQRNSVIRLVDNAFIPMVPENSDYQAYLTWVGEGNTAEAADPPPPPAANWAGFLVDLKGTTVFALLRGQARSNVAVNALATELRTMLGEAALGLAQPNEIQALLAELLPLLTAPQIAEVQAAIDANNIPLLTAPPE